MLTFLELYTLTNATKDFKAGKDPFSISIAKWESLSNATQQIRNTMGQACGLCLEYNEEGDYCEECPINSCYKRISFIQTINEELKDSIKKFIEYLQTEKEKHEQT